MIYGFQVNRWKNKGPWAQEALSLSLKIWIHNFIKINAASCSENNTHSNKTLFIIDNLDMLFIELIKSNVKLGLHFSPLKMF